MAFPAAYKESVLKIEEFWELYKPLYCECGDRATVCGECADCFWDNRERDRRLAWEERNGIFVPRFPCGGCDIPHRECDMFALNGETYCEGCFNEALSPLPIEELEESAIYAQLDELDQERKKMRQEGRQDTADYVAMDCAAQALTDELERRQQEARDEEDINDYRQAYMRDGCHLRD